MSLIKSELAIKAITISNLANSAHTDSFIDKELCKWIQCLLQPALVGGTTDSDNTEVEAPANIMSEHET